MTGNLEVLEELVQSWQVDPVLVLLGLLAVFAVLMGLVVHLARPTEERRDDDQG